MATPKTKPQMYLREMVLREVAEGNFRNSEKTLFSEWSKNNTALQGANDIVVFVAKTRTLMYFVHGHRVVRGTDTIHRVLWSEKLRLEGGTWNPLMLVNYAERVGIKLVGLKRFEEFYRKLVEEK